MDSPLSNQSAHQITAHQITAQLIAWSHGDEAALDEVIRTVYQELRRMADRYLRQERPGQIDLMLCGLRQNRRTRVGMRWQ